VRVGLAPIQDLYSNFTVNAVNLDKQEQSQKGLDKGIANNRKPLITYRLDLLIRRSQVRILPGPLPLDRSVFAMTSTLMHEYVVQGVPSVNLDDGSITVQTEVSEDTSV
jgi:hypothetical protein